MACFPQLLTLAAKSPTELEQATDRAARELQRNPSRDLAHTADQLRRKHPCGAHRRFTVARHCSEATQLLRERRLDAVVSDVAPNQRHPVVFLFPGSGAQYSGMGAGLYRSFPVFRQAIDECAEAFAPLLGTKISELYKSPEVSPLLEAEHSVSTVQPWIFATEYALARTLIDLGLRPDLLIGHSIGECVAACVGESISLSDAVRLVSLRVRTLSRLPAGAMLHVKSAPAAIRPLLVKGAELAAVNGDASCTVAGPCEAIQKLQVILEQNGMECRAVKIHVAGHCSLLDPFMEEFASEIRTVQTRVPATPVVSCVTGKPLSARDVGDPLHWVRQLRQTVRFRDGLRNVLRGDGALLIEVGPGNYLTFQTAAQLPARGSWRLVAAMRHRRQEGPDEDCLLNALGAAWTSGHSLNLNRLPDSTGAPRSARPSSSGA